MVHSQEIEAILAGYETTLAGLSENEAKKRLETYGRNELIIKEPKPLWMAFFAEFKDLLVIILIAAAILAGISGKIADMIVILIVVLINAGIGFMQKYKAEKAVEALQEFVSPRAIVIRDGAEHEIDAKLIVPGDIIVLAEGNRIAADSRLIETHELSIQESVLTGESTPAKKQVSGIENKFATPGEKTNMAHMGTIVAKGTGKAVVTATGMKTEFGRIAHLTVTTKKDPSPLQKELRKIGVFVGKITLGISIILIAVGITIQGKALIDTLLFAASVAVAAVPEGLPATVTIALALGVQRLAKKRAIVRDLASVETLGGTTVICSDKTGTLTKNEMTVEEIAVDHLDITVHGVGYEPSGALYIRDNQSGACITIGKPEIEDYEHRSITAQRLRLTHPQIHKALELISKTAILCNNANLFNREKTWKILGDPTEGALLTAAEKAGFGIKETKKECERIYEIPFASERKRMTTINKNAGNQKIFAYVKGAPDSILEKCSHIFLGGRVQKLDKRMERQIMERNEKMAGRALRVLGFAYRELNPKPEENYDAKDVEKNMIFVGLMGMIDPPREEVKDAVKLTHKAGIKTYIVTGDNGATAHAIAQTLGITGAYNVRIVTGTEMNQISNEKLTAIFKNEKEVIFARVSPEHKLRIVSSLKNLGERVAVTGDGVNDAPALKRADIGIAMGIAGTDVSREAANIILTDDSYATIVKAIEEGRTIYANLKKFIFFIFSCNIGELFAVFAAILIKMPAPLTAIFILIVNLGTDVLPALALGVDKPEQDVMSNPPRDPRKHILEAPFIGRFLYIGTIIGVIVTATYFITLTAQGWSWGEPLFENSFIYMKSSTIAFALLIIIQMVNAFNARSETRSIFSIGFFSNLWLLSAIILSVAMLILLTEIPFLQTILRTTHISLKEWGMILLASFCILAVEEIRKIISKNVRKNQSHP